MVLRHFLERMGMKRERNRDELVKTGIGPVFESLRKKGTDFYDRKYLN